MSAQIPTSDNQNPLGRRVEYSNRYEPSLLYSIEREEKRRELGIDTEFKFSGEDIWNAYEISWLNLSGVPQVAIGEFRVPSSSPKIIESKSLKLYLNSFNQSTFGSLSAVEATIQTDLMEMANSDIEVKLSNVDSDDNQTITSFDALCIDDCDIKITDYNYNPNLLALTDTSSLELVDEKLCSHLLKSNCLITNQPDWASILIEYKGRKISHSSLLRYLVSFRTHNEFHEQCVERIFCDLMNSCKPQELTVYARYTRRGGLDINPWRSNCLSTMDNIRLSRQ